MSHNTVLDIHHGSVELNSFNAAHKHSKNSTFEEHALDTENVAPGDIVFKSPNTSSYSSIPRTSSSSRHERPSKWRSRSAHGPPPPPPVGRSRSRSPARTPFNAGRRRGYASSLICSPARASHSSKMTQIFEDAQVTLHLKNRRSERKKTTQLLSAPRARRRPLGDLVNREPALQKQDAATVDPQTSTSHHSDKSSIDSCSLESGDARSPGFSSRYDSDSTSYGPVLERAQRRPHGEATNEALSMRHQGEVNASAPSFDPQPRARSPSSPQSKAMEHNSPDGGRSSPRYTAFRSSPNLHLSSSQFASSPRLPSLAPLSKLSEEMESAMGLSSGACTPWPSEKYRQFVADNAKYHPNSCLLPAADSITRGLGNLGMGDSTHQPPTSTTPATLAKGQLGSSSSAKHDEIEHTTTDHSGKQLQVAPMANGPTHESQPKNYSMDATAPLAGSCDDIQEERSESMAAPRSDWSGDDGLFRRRHPHEKFSGPTDGSVETANLLPNTPELRGQSLRLLDYEYDCQGRVSTCPKGPPRGHTLDDIAARLAVADSEDFQEAVNRATGGDDVDWTWNKNSFAKSPPETRVPNASPASHMRWPHELETSNSSNKANLSRTEHEHTVDTNMREIRRPWLSDEGLSSETCNDNRVSPNKSILSPMSETWTGDEEFYHSSATAESRPKTQTVPSWLKRIAGRQKHSSLFPGGLWRHDSVTCQTRPAFKAVVQDENLMHNDVNNDDASYRSSTGEDIYSALLENLSSPSSSYEGYSSPSPVRRHNTLCETSSRGVDGDEISLAPPELEPRRRSFPSLQCLPQASRVLGTHRGVNTLSEALIGHQETKQVHSRLHATPNFVQIIRKASNETADDDNDYVVHTHKSEPWTTESSEPQIIIGASSGGTAYDADWEDASPYRAPDTAHGQISTIPDISSSKSLIASRTTYGQLSRLSTAFSRTLGTPIRNECTVSTRHCSTDGEEEFLSAEESHAPALLSRPTRTFQRKTGMTRLKCSPAAPTLRGDMHGRCDSLISETPTCVERTAPAAANKGPRHFPCTDSHIDRAGREYNTASTMCGRSSHTTMEDLERFNPNVHDADGPELPWCTDNARLRLNAEQRKQLYASANAALEARGKQPYHTMTQESLRFTKADAVVTTIHDELPDGYEPHVSLSSLSGKPIAIELSSREGNKDLDTRATPTGIATSCTFSGDPTWGAALRDLRGDFATPAVAANPPSSPRPNGLAACINGRQRPVDRDESTFTFGERYLVGTANPHSKSRAVAAPSGHKAQSASSAPWHPASSSTAPPAPAPSADAAQHPYTVRSITAATRRALHDNSASAANGAADRRAAHAKAHHGNGGDADDDDDDDTPLSPLSPDVELHRGS